MTADGEEGHGGEGIDGEEAVEAAPSTAAAEVEVGEGEEEAHRVPDSVWQCPDEEELVESEKQPVAPGAPVGLGDAGDP